MKRLVAAALTVLVLWALVPAVGEFFENAVHLLTEGHTAHAAPDGDHHDPIGPEHGCTGTTHLCSCCVSISCLPAHAVMNGSAATSGDLLLIVSSHFASHFDHDVFRPPRV